MAKVTVYRFCLWNRELQENSISLRHATEKAIKATGAKDRDILRDTALQVDESELDGDEFYPKKQALSRRSNPT